MTNEKTEVQAFIEDAIAGGVFENTLRGRTFTIEETKERGVWRVYPEGFFAVPFTVNLWELLLSKFAWQAVGKTRGWGTEMVLIDEPGHPKEWCYFEHCDRCGAVINDQEDGCPDGCRSDNAYVPSWLYEQHRFIDHLADGKSVDEALQAIT